MFRLSQWRVTARRAPSFLHLFGEQGKVWKRLALMILRTSSSRRCLNYLQEVPSSKTRHQGLRKTNDIKVFSGIGFAPWSGLHNKSLILSEFILKDFRHGKGVVSKKLGDRCLLVFGNAKALRKALTHYGFRRYHALTAIVDSEGGRSLKFG